MKEKYTIYNLPLFINVYYIRDGKEKMATVQTRDFNGRQDAKIGDFSENWYIRPAKALKVNCNYKDLASYKKSISLCMKKQLNATVTRYAIPFNHEGVEYDKTI